MSQEDQIERFFADVTETMRLKFRGWEQDIPHDGEKGGIRERRVADFLVTILPKRFGIGSGHIVNSQGEMSSQLDIVIYDAIEGIKLSIDDYYSLFPLESVCGVIEVKSTLTGGVNGSISQCVEAATKLKLLDRQTEGSPKDIPYIVFAYQAKWKNEIEQVRKSFHRFRQGGKSLPDMTFVLDPGFLLVTYRMVDRTRYSHIYLRAPLLLFISELLNRFSKVESRTTNLWQTYLTWKSGEIITRIYPKDDQYYEVKSLAFTEAEIAKK